MNPINSSKITATAMTVRQQFGGLLNQVALQGAEVTIERAGKPIARLVPVGETSQTTSTSSKKHDFRDLGRHPSKLWQGIQADSYVKEERDSW